MRLSAGSLLIIRAILWSLFVSVTAEDFYQLLGVSKDADNRAIRQAFKKLAISKHPDKNPDNKEAHAEFVRINRAYEVLKDEELRKKYDLHGEDGLKDDFHGGQQYQSWQFYRDNFGIYDDDPEIVTLNRVDFQSSVTETNDRWFINFYSTYCSHCHTLAPTWRKVARELDGAIRIGAVNCAEDPMLCQSQRVMAYPSLVMYPEGEFFNGQRELDPILAFAMERISSQVHKVNVRNINALTKEWDDFADKPWVIDFCDDSDSCLSSGNRRKLAAMLEGLVNVGTISCVEGEQREKLCDTLKRNQGVVYYPAGQIDPQAELELNSLDAKELANSVLALLPDANELTPLEYTELVNNVATGDYSPALIHFFSREAGEPDLELRRLPAILTEIDLARVDCSKMLDTCASMHLSKLPAFVMFKSTGGYEIHYGKATAREVTVFARESAEADMRAMDDTTFNEAVASGEIWIIDFFAPWCPPCMRLLPELRKAVKEMDGTVRVGTIDCTVHLATCQRAGVSSYPTTIVYNDTRPNPFVGFHSAQELIQFVEDVRSPPVMILTPDDMRSSVVNREKGKLWLVDFFAPWCGPCQQLAPEFRALARLLREEAPNVSLGTVDCQQHQSFCQSFSVHTYPTIRLFPANQAGYIDYPNNWWRDHGSMKKWLADYLPSLVAKMGEDFFETVLKSDTPWLVDFYAPWCGHCVTFAPVFEQIAKKLEGRVNLAKIDCDRWSGVCRAVGIRGYPSIRLYTGVVGGQSQATDGIEINSQHAPAILEMVELHVAEHQRTKDAPRDEL